MTRRLLPYAEPVRCSLCGGQGFIDANHSPDRDPQKATIERCPLGCQEPDTHARPTARERKAKGRAWEGT